MTILAGDFKPVDVLISFFFIEKVEQFLHGHLYKLTSVHWERQMCNFDLEMFTDYAAVQFSYQWIIKVTDLPKHAVKPKSTNKFSSFPQ